jgi:hypothetical protein
MAEPKGPESGGQPKSTSAARPRPQTLDLSATEVSKAEARNAEAATASAQGTESSKPAAPKPDDVATKPSGDAPGSLGAKTSDPAAVKTGVSSDEASTKAAAGAPAEPAPAPSATSKAGPSSTSPNAEARAAARSAGGASADPKASIPPSYGDGDRSEGIGFLGAAAAAVAGAVIAVLVVVAFGRYLIRAPEADLSRVIATESKLDGLRRDVAALNQRLGQIVEATDTKAIGAGLGELDGRLQELGKAVESSNGRVTGVENELRGLVEKVANPPADPAIGVLAGRVEGIELRAGDLVTKEELAVLTSRIENAERRIVAAPTKDDLASVTTGVAALGDKIDPLADEVGSLSDALKARPKGDPAARLVVALGALGQALDAGRPFAAELASVKAAAGETAELAALDGYAQGGLPTRAVLSAELRTIVSELPPLKPGAQSSVFDRFVANAGAVVKITPQDASGSDPSAVRARVESLAEAGDVEQALAARVQLDVAARAATDDWAAKASARIGAEDALRGARTAALARLSAND